MTYINPSYKSPAPQSLKTLLNALAHDIMKNINCAKVGTIQSFNATLQEATIEIAFTQVTSVSPTGVKTFAQYPLLVNVPVAWQGGGGVTATFPIAAGDECIVIFNDRQIDNWLATGAGQPPSIGRVHDLSDGMAIVGIRNNTRALANVSTTEAQLRTDDGLTFVGINPTTQAVRVHGGTVYEWDVQGYGQKITWTGGKNYTIDNYNADAIVTTNSHNTSPPGPP